MYAIEFELSRPTKANLDENTLYLFLENKEWKFIIVSNKKKYDEGDLKEITNAQKKLDEFLKVEKTTYNKKSYLENIQTDNPETILKKLLSQQNSRFELYHNVINLELSQELLKLIKPDSKDAPQGPNYKSLLTVLKETIRLRIYYLFEWFALKHQKKAGKKVTKLIADTQEAIKNDNLDLACQTATSLHQAHSESLNKHEVIFNDEPTDEIKCYETLQNTLKETTSQQDREQALQTYCHCRFFSQSEAPVNTTDHQLQNVSSQNSPVRPRPSAISQSS